MKEEKVTINDYLSNGVAYFRQQWPITSTCKRIVLIFAFIILLPFLLEAGLAIIAIGVLLPLGLFVGLTEHKAVPLYALLILFIHLGAIADNAADLVLLVEVIFYYKVLSFGFRISYRSKSSPFSGRIEHREIAVVGEIVINNRRDNARSAYYHDLSAISPCIEHPQHVRLR